MCGFVGFHSSDGSPPGLVDRLSTALAAIRHRGPDGEGVYTNPWLGMAHARLAIIDPGESAQQPMVDRAGRFILVFNGEIYNYRELYVRYCDEDPTVNGHSDTAVLLALYQRFGAACLELLDGMFAFAVADVRARTLFLARDRFGEKPLYWVRRQNAVLFGSELTALKALASECPWGLDPESIALFHMMGSIPPPQTIYRDVRALRPGCWLRVSTEGDIVEGRYWSLECTTGPSAGEAGEHGYEALVEGTRARLLQAVESRMVSDVEVGLFLSGGIDSGALLGLLKAQKRTPVAALCIDFPPPADSEFEMARVTADQYNGLLHRQTISAETFLAGMDGFFSAMDQPTGDGYNTFFVSRAAHQLGIKVWLSGVGGDELFGGYPFFKRITSLSRLTRALQLAVPTLVVEKGAFLCDNLRIARLLHLADGGDAYTRAYQVCRNPVPWRNALMVLHPSLRESLREINDSMDGCYPYTGGARDDFQRATLLESSMYMRAQLLRDMDNFSMAHSIELRAPYLDHRLFEYVFRAPQAHKRRSGQAKPLLADALPIPLPPAVVRQTKRGFTFPVEVWLKQQLGRSFEAHVMDRHIDGLYDRHAVTGLWHAYRKGAVHSSVIWNLYAFARWVGEHHESV